MSDAYYNENDPYAAQWLRNLIAAGHIASGDVDERSIVDVRANDLAGYSQCHFFAGIGGWSYALRLAGWPDNRPVWTGSCPCQPFSANGKRKGFADDRHLWPDWFRLIKARRPAIMFGEQSARAPKWLALVRSDLDSLGYAVGAIPIEAASAGAEHYRDRYWFVANADYRDSHRRNCSVQNGRLRSQEKTSADAVVKRVQWPAESMPPTLAYGVSNRVEQVCAYGNAIVPQVAAEFIRAAAEAI